MKTTLCHYGAVALLLAVILLLSTLLSLFTGLRQGEDRPRILVTTYPLYVAAQNVLGDTDGVDVTLLSGAGAGCLHDYQLTPADRLAIEKADLVVINGVGAEPFLDGLVEESRLVDASHWIPNLICAEGHNHGHVEMDMDHHHEESTYNQHVWMSPGCYQYQIQAVMGALILLNPADKDTYLSNGTAYDEEVHALGWSLPRFDGRPCVLFHDSLSYLAEDAGFSVKLTLSAEGESGLSAADLAKVEQLAKQHPDLVLLYDTQYPIRYTAVDGLVPPHQVMALETAVVGSGKPSDWLDAMGRNVKKLQSLKGGDTP